MFDNKHPKCIQIHIKINNLYMAFHLSSARHNSSTLKKTVELFQIFYLKKNHQKPSFSWSNCQICQADPSHPQWSHRRSGSILATCSTSADPAQEAACSAASVPDSGRAMAQLGLEMVVVMMMTMTMMMMTIIICTQNNKQYIYIHI